MTSERQLRAYIKADSRYAHLNRLPIDHAIAEIRRLRAVDRQYHEGNHGK